ncbi:MAG: hypothetical protein JSS53_03350, partial [Proteobacteria bacterium]|nr:hypothetical protein [Pseudomonadota bacterium]
QEAIIQKWNELKRYADFRHGSTLTFSVFSQSFNANRAVLDKKLDVEYLMQLAQLDTVKLNRLGIWLLADQMMKKSLELMSAEETTIEFQINQPNAKRYREEAEKLYKSIFGELERNPENLIKYYNESQQKQRMKSEEEEFGSSKDPESGYSTPLPSGSSANDLTKMERSASVERRNSELARSEDGSQGLHRNAQSFSVALSKNPAGTSKAVQQNLALDTTKKQEESATASQNYERLHASIMTHKELPSQALFNRIRTGFETLELTQSDRMAVADFLVEQYSIPKRGSLFFAKPQGVQFEQIERVYLVSWDRTQDINFLLKLAKTLFDKHKSTQNLDDFKKALKYKKDYLDNAFKQELMPINDLIEFVSLVNNTSKGSYSTEINSWLTRAAEHYASEIPRNPSPGNYECLAKVRFLQSEQIPDNSSIDEKNQGMQAALEAEYQYFQAMQGDGYEIPIERFIKFARLSLNQYKNMTGSIEHGAEIDTWLEQALNTCMRMNRQEVDAVSRADNYWYSAELCFLQADRTAVGTLKDAKLGQGIKYQDDYKNAYAKISSDTLSEEKKRQHAVRLEMCDWKMRVYLNRGSTGQSSPPVLTQ